MTQDERWLVRYKEMMWFLEENHRNPSKHRIEEHDYLNWLKANRKVMNAGKMKQDRVEKFIKLLELTELYKRKKQFLKKCFKVSGWDSISICLIFIMI